MVQISSKYILPSCDHLDSYPLVHIGYLNTSGLESCLELEGAL